MKGVQGDAPSMATADAHLVDTEGTSRAHELFINLNSTGRTCDSAGSRVCAGLTDLLSEPSGQISDRHISERDFSVV